ncbi:hypothetical protein B0A52_02060 [Exophiala mesophila]|uniref:Uncharacterized protein n=1 Tax=Exophiala mesophila TaxID=212818 RepID=A0A438NER4_EXOME|nr:hypothetical protein B0A52_02060 [Exophiala mesophila]
MAQPKSPNDTGAPSQQTQTSYFRGRKLKGRVIKIADGYEGVVAESTDRYLPQPAHHTSVPRYTTIDDDIEIEEADQDEDDEDDEPPEPVRLLQQASTFSDVVVWGHDAVPDADDSFVKGVQDWIAFAQALHGDPGAVEKADDDEMKDDSV